MDFLLECIGFPPGTDLEALRARVIEEGEPVPWRSRSGLHLRLALGGGLEVRLDQEEGQAFWSLNPWFESQRRLRVRVARLLAVEDAPLDRLLFGLANPPPPPAGVLAPEDVGEDYPITLRLDDARRVAHALPEGHVLAISLSGFALDVDYVGPNQGVKSPAILDEPCGARLAPVGGAERPGGAMEVSVRVRSVRRLRNPLTDVEVDVVEVDAPGRPLELFVSRWQLAEEGFEPPRPGWRIEGVFLFSGRVSGGLSIAPERRGVFG